MRAPWHGEQLRRVEVGTGFQLLRRERFRLLRHGRNAGHSERGDDAFHQSGISANVQTDPPCGTFLSASRLMFQYSPPMPESTLTYCLPLCVYVTGWALMPEPVWNCHSCAPVSASRAMNSPVSFPVKTSPPPVDSVADQICRSVSGTPRRAPESCSGATAACRSRGPIRR